MNTVIQIFIYHQFTIHIYNLLLGSLAKDLETIWIYTYSCTVISVALNFIGKVYQHPLAALKTLVQWWRRFIMLPQQHVVIGYKQTNQSMNRMIARLIQQLVCVTNEKDMACQQQIWSTFVAVLWCSKTKITDRTGILVLVRVLWDTISKIYWKFWYSFFKNAPESRYNFNQIEITWRTRRFSNHVSRLLLQSHTFAIIILLHLKIHQSMWIHWPFFPKTWNQRSLTPRWPLTPCLLRSHVWLYPRIIVSKSHDNTLMYVDTVINFAKYHIHTYILHTEWVIT